MDSHDPPDSTRSSLLVRLKDPADQEAWRIFDQVYRPLLFRYARSCGLAQNDADDAVQDTLQRVLVHIGDYEHSGSFKSYLHTIVRNIVCDVHRRRGEGRLDSTEWLRQTDASGGPDAEFEECWLAAHLNHCLERVRRRVQARTYQIYEACVGSDNRRPAEVAREFGVTSNHVYQCKFKVLIRVEACLHKQFGIDLDLRGHS